jgi:riboflavin synthase
MRLGDRLGGHLVTGHIDCKAEVSKLLNIGDCWDLKVLVPREFAKYCIKKGSACLDGISLTINDIEDHQSHSVLSFTIIPTTWHGTNLQRRSVNQLVNLEVDSFVKYFERLNRSIA